MSFIDYRSNSHSDLLLNELNDNWPDAVIGLICRLAQGDAGGSREIKINTHIMKTLVRSLCVASLLLGGVAVVRADDGAAAKKAVAEAPKPSKEIPTLSPEQRETKAKEMKAKFETQLKDLHAKKAAGKLTEEETKKLERMEKRAAKSKEKAEAKADHKSDHKPDHKADPK